MIKATLEKDLLKLSNTTLDKISGNVKKPLYDRARLKAGIVHIGLGNFHRAHQAWFLHQLMQAGEAMDWAIVGAGVREFDSKQRQKLLAQDFLTTLIELDPKGQSAEIIGSMIDYVPIAEGNADLIARMAQEDIRIVSLTVTEGGYYIDPLSTSLDAAHPDIQHDAKYPETPKTVFGAMIAALKLRREAGVGPFTGQSCDNLQGNGAILRRTVVSLAALSDPDLAVWIDQKCSFPNSMVDCIVPATGPLECELVRTLGIDDAVPVTHENFRQWVIEDDFCAGRPNWEKVSVTMSSDVHTFESMKIQILNAGHQILANLGEIIGLNTIDQCMQHDEISSFFEQVQRREIVPHVAAVPGMQPQDYVGLVASRFANPKIKDTVRRVAFDGAARHSGFLHPTIRAALSCDTAVAGLALVEAIWARMCYGIREDGSTIAANDPNWSFLSALAKRSKESPSLWLSDTNLYGDIAEDPRFHDAFCTKLTHIWKHGACSTIKDYCSRGF
ncbi:MAG: mannitol dehydrogenase family protein [Paracoccaceae bacterium]